MAKKVDLVGQKFGRLKVVREAEPHIYPSGQTARRWLCICSCDGKEVTVQHSSLISGAATSCGCYHRERAAEANTTHGMARHGKQHHVYRIWAAMLERCGNPNNKSYKDYGGRGITVCKEWHNSAIFINWALASGWKKGLSIDRIDNNSNYEPDNCRWVTSKENNRNRRSNHLISFDGKIQTMGQWAEELNMSPATLNSRINILHWPIERALTEPVKKRA